MERIFEGNYFTVDLFSYELLQDISKYIDNIKVSTTLEEGQTIVKPSKEAVVEIPHTYDWEKIYCKVYPLVNSEDFNFYLTVDYIVEAVIKALGLDHLRNLKTETLFYGISYLSSLYPNEILDAMFNSLCEESKGFGVSLHLKNTTNWNAEKLKNKRHDIEQVSPILQMWKKIQEDQLQLHLQLQTLDNKTKYGDVYGRVCQRWLEYAATKKGPVQDSFGDKSPSEPSQLSNEAHKTLGQNFEQLSLSF